MVRIVHAELDLILEIRQPGESDWNADDEDEDEDLAPRAPHRPRKRPRSAPTETGRHLAGANWLEPRPPQSPTNQSPPTPPTRPRSGW